MLATVVFRLLGNADVNPFDEIIGGRLVLGAVSDDVLSLDCDMIVDGLVIRDVDVTDVVGLWDETEELLGFTEENEMTVLLNFALDVWYWGYVAEVI